ncbi:MAG: tRNA-specific adenosine deaminase [Bacteroidetes bacterium]|jgi:tRNA(adenine34) deaminase|nr:MAG: tRNA-specific adenosine deaminase [Bacteroidota bacterium]PTM20599.1 MAG: tRNA-specific adenosine deaminase [Bacteroidota bacterium]
MNEDEFYMNKALRLANEASERGEVPVGAIIIKGNRVVGQGRNQTEQLNDVTAHAEMIALTAAFQTLGQKYLQGCTLYVTLEPCMMCAGAIVWSKLDRVVIGALDERSGGCGSAFNIAANQRLNHQAEIQYGVLEDECSRILKQFFQKKRKSLETE